MPAGWVEGSRFGVAAACEAGLDIAALLFFPVLVLLPRGTAALVSVAGVCAAGLLVSGTRRRLSVDLVSAAVLLAALLVWGALSAAWSVDPPRSLAVAARLAGLFAAGLALAAAAGWLMAPFRLTAFLLAGLVLGLVLTALDLATAGWLSRVFSDRPFHPTWLNQASMSFAILLFPAAAVLFCLGRRIAAGLLAAATAAAVFGLAGTAAKAVLITGAPIGLFLLCRAGRTAARVAAIVSVVTIITAPVTFARLERVPGLGVAADDFKISAGHRLLIWSFTGDRIAEHPLTGWGLDSSRAIPGGDDLIRPQEAWLPLHPHNAALQVWLELGVPGATLFALLVALAWAALARSRWPRLFAAAVGGSLTVALVGSFATYGVWQEWWLGMLWFALFAVLAMARAVERVGLEGGEGEYRSDGSAAPVPPSCSCRISRPTSHG